MRLGEFFRGSLEANTLIFEYGASAEEYVTAKLWEARAAKDDSAVAIWQLLIEAVKEVRETTQEVHLEPPCVAVFAYIMLEE